MGTNIERSLTCTVKFLKMKSKKETHKMLPNFFLIGLLILVASTYVLKNFQRHNETLMIYLSLRRRVNIGQRGYMGNLQAFDCIN